MTTNTKLEERREELLGAIARGWCSENNAHKEMDAELATAIADELMPFLAQERAQMVKECMAAMPETPPIHRVITDHPGIFRAGFDQCRAAALEALSRIEQEV